MYKQCTFILDSRVGKVQLLTTTSISAITAGGYVEDLGRWILHSWIISHLDQDREKIQLFVGASRQK